MQLHDIVHAHIHNIKGFCMHVNIHLIYMGTSIDKLVHENGYKDSNLQYLWPQLVVSALQAFVTIVWSRWLYLSAQTHNVIVNACMVARVPLHSHLLITIVHAWSFWYARLNMCMTIESLLLALVRKDQKKRTNVVNNNTT